MTHNAEINFDPTWGLPSFSVSTFDDTTVKPLTIRAHGKAIVIGEHAVLYGSRAIAVPVKNLGMEISVSSRPCLTQHKIKIGKERIPETLVQIIDQAFHLLEIKPSPLEINIKSNLMISRGLGSSAALCVGILRAILILNPKDIENHELARMANELEKHFHGSPSGLDTRIVAYEKALSFQRREIQSPLIIKKISDECSYWPFALIDSGIGASTLAMIQKARPYFESHGQPIVDHFTRLAEWVQKGFAQGIPLRVGEAMDQAHSLLFDAGIYTTKLKDIVLTAKKLGCLGAKVTGAGGGGCALVLLNPSEQTEQFAELRKAFGSQVYPLPVWPQ